MTTLRTATPIWGCASNHPPRSARLTSHQGAAVFQQGRPPCLPSGEMSTDGAASLASTQWMFDRYPADIRAWIEAKGGVEKMPYVQYWHLPASDLWAMGYRRCAD
jgi:hypothetical protein